MINLITTLCTENEVVLKMLEQMSQKFAYLSCVLHTILNLDSKVHQINRGRWSSYAVIFLNCFQVRIF